MQIVGFGGLKVLSSCMAGLKVRMTHVFSRILKSTNWVMTVPSFLISRKQFLVRIFIHVYSVIQHILCYPAGPGCSKAD